MKKVVSSARIVELRVADRKDNLPLFSLRERKFLTTQIKPNQPRWYGIKFVCAVSWWRVDELESRKRTFRETGKESSNRFQK